MSSEWSSPTESERYCSRFMCTSSNKTWIPSYSFNNTYDEKSGCDALINAGIT